MAKKKIKKKIKKLVKKVFGKRKVYKEKDRKIVIASRGKRSKFKEKLKTGEKFKSVNLKEGYKIVRNKKSNLKRKEPIDKKTKIKEPRGRLYKIEKGSRNYKYYDKEWIRKQKKKKKEEKKKK